LGRPIRVKLNSGIEYRGILGSLDGYLNIAMEQTEEYSTTGQLQAKYGDCFIRGNNGTFGIDDTLIPCMPFQRFVTKSPLTHHVISRSLFFILVSGFVSVILLMVFCILYCIGRLLRFQSNVHNNTTTKISPDRPCHIEVMTITKLYKG
jgi:U6 snRNA-associated Sm-like protein LSm6